MLDKVIIEGYKSIKRIDLELKPINILIGSNGVGKTNFVSFFKLINNIYEQRLYNYTMQNNAEKLFHYGRKQTKELKGYLKFGDNAYEVILQPRDNGSLFIAEERSYYKGQAYWWTNVDESLIKDSTTYRDKWLRISGKLQNLSFPRYKQDRAIEKQCKHQRQSSAKNRWQQSSCFPLFIAAKIPQIAQKNRIDSAIRHALLRKLLAGTFHA